MKRIFIAVPFLVAVLLAVLLVAPGFMDWNQYKSQIQAQIEKASGYKAELRGNLSLAILPTPRVYIEDVSVAAPAGSAKDTLIQLKRMAVHLSLLPLLSGQVDFNSISLINPVIALEVFADGRKNWMTPQLEAMTAPREGQQAGPSIALKQVTVEEGSFSYIDRSIKNPMPVAVSDVNVTASAETLQGPFTLEGDLSYEGRNITLKGATQSLERGSKSVPVNFTATISPDDLSVEFAGVIDTSEPMQVQGETSLHLDSLESFAQGAPGLSGPVDLKGLLTGSQDKFQIKNAAISFGSNSFAGDLAVNVSPLKVEGAFKAAKTVNVDEFYKPAAGSNKEVAVNLLPETFSFPADVELALKLSAPGFVYNGGSYRNATITLGKQDKSFAAAFAADGIPGGGNIEGKGVLKFATMTQSEKDKTSIYSEPQAELVLKGRTQNIVETAEALGFRDVTIPDYWKSAAINATFNMTPESLSIKNGAISLGETNFGVSGSYSSGSGGRPVLLADVAADKIDLDRLQKKAAASETGPSFQDTLRSLVLPFDFEFDLGAQEAFFQGQKIKGLRAQGSLKPNVLTLKNFSAQDYAGTAFKAEAGIANLKELSGLDIRLSGQSQDVRGLANVFGLDTSELPETLRQATLALAVTGNISKMAVNAGISALNGTLSAKGNVGDPMGTIAVSEMAIQLRHRNLAEAIALFSPGSPRYVSLEKPIDFYADIDRKGTVYSLANMAAKIGDSPIKGTLSVDTGPARPVVKGDLKLGDLAIQSARGSGRSASPAVRSKGGSSSKWSSEPLDTAWMHSCNADLNVTASSLAYEGWAFQKPVIRLKLQDGLLTLEKLDAGFYGGAMSATGSLKSSPSGNGPVALQSSMKFSEVAVEGLSEALIGSRLIQGQGIVSMDSTLETSGGSANALISGLKGTGTLTGKDLVLDGFDVSRFAEALSAENRAGDSVVGLWAASTGGGSTSFDTLDGAYAIAQGVITISRLDLDGTQSKIATTGKADLPSWTLDTAHTITLKQKPDVPPFTIHLSGPIDDPVQTFVEGAIKDYLTRKINRKIEKLISKRLGMPEEEGAAQPDTAMPEGQQPQQQKPLTPEEAIQGVIGDLLKR